MFNNNSRKEKCHVYNLSNQAEIMIFASLFESFEEETENFEYVFDDEDYEDPALYELLKDTPKAKYFKKQKTSHDTESSDRISDVGLGGDDLDSASLDNV
ncbi:unnamed protein product [Rhizopus stolonifer]